MSKWRVEVYYISFLFQEVDDMATPSNTYHVSCRSGQKLSFTARLQSCKFESRLGNVYHHNQDIDHCRMY